MNTFINSLLLSAALVLPQFAMAKDADMPMMPEMQQQEQMQNCQINQEHRMQMQQQMQDMQGLMGKIQQEKDSSQIRDMMHQHMGMMQHGMQMMGEMPGSGMMQHKRMQGQSMSMGDGCGQVRGQHMQMMQQMMQQMMMHMQMMERE